MVHLTEVQKMFWGLTLTGSQQYSQTVEQAFHVSMAALQGPQENVEVWITYDKAQYLLSTLSSSKCCQQPLDLNFNEGEEVTFFLGGKVASKASVHLTGYLAPEGMFEDDEEMEGEDDEGVDYPIEIPGKGLKRKIRDSKAAAVKKTRLDALNEPSDNESEDDDEYNAAFDEMVAAEEDCEYDDYDDDDDDSDDDDDDSDNESLDEENASQKHTLLRDAGAEDDSDEDDSDYGDEDEGEDEDLDENLFYGSEDSEDEDSEDEDVEMESPMKLNGQQGKKTSRQIMQSDKQSAPGLTPKGQNHKSKGQASSAKDTPKGQKDTPKGLKGQKNTPKGQKSTPQGQKNAPQGQKNTPQGQKNTSQGQKNTPQGQKNTPQGQKNTPQGQKNTSQGQKNTPQGQKNTPQGQKNTPQGQKNTPQGQKNTPQGQNTGSANKKNKGTANNANSSPVTTKKGGVSIEEMKVGSGTIAQSGNKVAVSYVGRLANGKVFDRSSKPLKFLLGKNEVIKGWDIGIAGMKVGGKRKLVVPPNLGYGSENIPDIPSGSTLHFDVELVNA